MTTFTVPNNSGMAAKVNFSNILRQSEWKKSFLEVIEHYDKKYFHDFTDETLVKERNSGFENDYEVKVPIFLPFPNNSAEELGFDTVQHGDGVLGKARFVSLKMKRFGMHYKMRRSTYESHAEAKRELAYYTKDLVRVWKETNDIKWLEAVLTNGTKHYAGSGSTSLADAKLVDPTIADLRGIVMGMMSHKVTSTDGTSKVNAPIGGYQGGSTYKALVNQDQVNAIMIKDANFHKFFMNGITRNEYEKFELIDSYFNIQFEKGMPTSKTTSGSDTVQNLIVLGGNESIFKMNLGGLDVESFYRDYIQNQDLGNTLTDIYGLIAVVAGWMGWIGYTVVRPSQVHILHHKPLTI